MCAKQTCPNYSVGSDQDEAEIQYDRLSIKECYNCEKCEKMPTNLECLLIIFIQKLQQDSPGIQRYGIFGVEFNFFSNIS